MQQLEHHDNNIIIIILLFFILMYDVDRDCTLYYRKML